MIDPEVVTPVDEQNKQLVKINLVEAVPMFSKLIRGILGLVGIIRETTKYDTSDNAKFLSDRCPGEILLIGPGDQALPNAISAAEGRLWAHCFLFVGTDWATRMRKKYAAIFEALKLVGVTDVAPANTIIEAEGAGIQENSMDKYMGSGQMVGFSRKLTDDQLEKLFLWMYQQVGKPYGYLTFMTELFPNPSDIPVSDPGWICSGLVTEGYHVSLGYDIMPKGVNPPQASPPDVYDGLEPQVVYGKDYYNCVG